MKNKYCILILIIFSSFFISCSDETDNNIINPPIDPTLSQSVFKYPYNINSFWYYTTRNFVTNLRPDSLSVYFPSDTLVGYGDASFVKDTVINQDTVRLLRNSHSEPKHSHTTLEYYKQTDSGLIRIAFYSEGANFGPFRPLNTNLTYSVNGLSFNSLNEIYEHYNSDNSVRGSLIFDDPPITAIKYPIVQNEEWNFVSYSSGTDTTRITKKFTDFETLILPSGTFYCIKIRRNWYYSSPTPDTNYISFDYFSKEGMIKRDFRIKDIIISNSNGPIGYIDVKEEANLNLYSIP
ncbi:MAG: hypothetical protein ABI840_06800 [bacterium]